MQKARKEAEAHAERAQQIEDWRDKFLNMAIAASHGEVLVNVLQKLNALLDTAPPFSDLTAHVRQLIDTEMRPIRDREQRERALADHRDRIERLVRAIDLPAIFGALDVARDEPEEARDVARTALAAFPPEASDRQLHVALQQAITPVRQRIALRHSQRERADEVTHRLRMLPWLSHSPKGAYDRMVRDVRTALQALPLGATAADLDAAAEHVVSPFRVADRQAETLKREEQKSAAAKHAAELRWIPLRSHIDMRASMGPCSAPIE